MRTTHRIHQDNQGLYGTFSMGKHRQEGRSYVLYAAYANDSLRHPINFIRRYVLMLLKIYYPRLVRFTLRLFDFNLNVTLLYLSRSDNQRPSLDNTWTAAI